MEIREARPTPAARRPRPRRKDNAPVDGLSHYNPRVALWARPLNKLAMHLLFKHDYEGLDKLPATGGYLICPNHQSMVDAPLVGTLTDRDNRFMAAKEQFVGLQGWLMTQAGAFPVDRKRPGNLPVDHARDLIDHGKPVVMFPEGGIFKTGQVEALKPGAARIATSSDCQAIYPVTIHYQKSEAPTAARQAAGLALSAGVTALAAAGACFSPTVRALTGAVTGGLVGVQLGQKPLQKVLSTVGGVLTGAVGAALAPGAVGLVTGLGTGVLAYKFDQYMAHRDTVRVVVHDGLQIEDYKKRYGAQAEEKLTEDLHTALNTAKVRMEAEAPSVYPF